MSVCFKLKGQSVTVNLVIGYAPTGANHNTQMKEKEVWEKLGRIFEDISIKERSVRASRLKRTDWNEGGWVW